MRSGTNHHVCAVFERKVSDNIFPILPTQNLILLKPKIFHWDNTRSSERLDEDEEWEDRKVVRATVVMSMSISFDSRKTTFPRRIPVKWLKPPFLSFRLDFFLIRGMSKLSRKLFFFRKKNIPSENLLPGRYYSDVSRFQHFDPSQTSSLPAEI